MRESEYAALQLVTAPTVEPVALSEAKANLRVDHSDDDTLITACRDAARVYTEKILGKSLLSQVRKVTYEANHIPNNGIVNIPFGPLISIDSVKYYNSSDVLTTVSTDDYTTDLLGDRLKFDDLPNLEDRPNALEINYTAGYGTASTDVPTPIIQAVKFLTNHLYEQRVPVINGTISTPVPFTYNAILYPYTELLK